MEDIDIEALSKEMHSVKMLLILQALALGCQQKHVAAALGVSDATLSRMFPKGFAKEVAKIADRRGGAEVEVEA
jgi:DNA-binding transcriptional regulator YdaS (Cro superfamily)